MTSVKVLLNVVPHSLSTPTMINVDMDMRITDGAAPVNKIALVAGASPVMCNLDAKAAKYMLQSHHLTYMYIALHARRLGVAGMMA